MDYQEAQRYILSFTDYEKIPGAFAAANFDLSRMDALLQPLGHPHRSLNCVHIAGTKGKGSTAAMIASALTASGYRTGLYTSPHLHTIRERFRIDGVLITTEEFSAMTEMVQPAVEAARHHPSGTLTTFEILTALAFLYFGRCGVHWAVLETGLGGRLDATNVITPQVAVITSISYDHTEVLGKTLTQIAREKAGIIKPGVPLVTSPQTEAAMAALREVCQERHSPLTQVGTEVTWRRLTHGLWGQSFQVKGRKGNYNLFIPLIGDHQLENAATAVAALEWVGDKAQRISPATIAQGLAAVSWEGRLQVIGHRPLTVVDGAHNADSARRLRESLSLFSYEKLLLIMGTSQDKDVVGIVRELSPLRPVVAVTAAGHPRAAPPALLAQEWAQYGIEAHIAPDVPQVLAWARAHAGERDLILVTGSLFIVAEALEAVGLAQKEDF